MKTISRSRCLVLASAACALLIAGFVASVASAADTEKLVTFFRKKNNVGPEQKVEVRDIKDSPIKGAKEGTLQIGTPPRSQNVSFTMSEDGRYVIFGDVEDLTVDPFKSVMKKISLDKYSRGPADAKVTIVEYSDFQCPFCKRGYETIENQVLKEYGNKVRFVYKHFPLGFHPWATPGAVAVECAGKQNEEAYWKVYHTLFDKQGEISKDGSNLKEKVDEALAGSSVDMAKFNQCFEMKETLDQVRGEMAEGQSVGITGTPGFIINGRVVSGAQPFEKFKAIIDDELSGT